jgi:hypothetical protein
MPYEIENDIPLPKPTAGGPHKGEMRKAIETLSIGQSIFVRDKKNNYVSSICQPSQKKFGYRFTVRTVDGGCRIWRIK